MKKASSVKSRWLVSAALCAVTAALYFLRDGGTTDQSSEASVPLMPLRVVRSSGSVEIGSSALRQILDSATAPSLRIDLVMNCEENLSDQELDTLLAEISTPMAVGGDLAWHSQYFHEICRQLQRHDRIRERFVRVLVGVAQDAGRGRIERDYAIQHMRQVWHRVVDDEALRHSIMLSFRSLANAGPEVAGPAILSLHFLGSDPEKPWKSSSVVFGDVEILPLVAGILQGEPGKSDTGTFMAAMRVAGDRNLPETAKRIEEIAADVSAATVVRMAAISIVGSSSSNPASFLQSIDRTDPRIDQAVRLTLDKLN